MDSCGTGLGGEVIAVQEQALPQHRRCIRCQGLWAGACCGTADAASSLMLTSLVLVLKHCRHWYFWCKCCSAANAASVEGSGQGVYGAAPLEIHWVLRLWSCRSAGTGGSANWCPKVKQAAPDLQPASVPAYFACVFYLFFFLHMGLPTTKRHQWALWHVHAHACCRAAKKEVLWSICSGAAAAEQQRAKSNSIAGIPLKRNIMQASRRAAWAQPLWAYCKA